MPYLCLVHWEWGAPKTCPYKWWGPQKIQLNLRYTLPLLSQLGVRGASWEWREGPLAQQRWWPPQNLLPQVVGTPKHTPWPPLWPTSAQSILSEGSKLEARGGGIPKLAATGGWHPKTYPSISITTYLCSVDWEWGEQAGSKPPPNKGDGHPKNLPNMWLGPQNIPFDLHYPLPLFGPLEVNGARWQQGEQGE